MKGRTMKVIAINPLGRISLGLVAALLGTSALAAPECTQAPKEQWMAETTMKTRIAEQGYNIKRFLVSGSCYEIYGKNKEGKNVEVYFNPVTGAIVKQRVG